MICRDELVGVNFIIVFTFLNAALGQFRKLQQQRAAKYTAIRILSV